MDRVLLALPRRTWFDSRWTRGWLAAAVLGVAIATALLVPTRLSPCPFRRPGRPCSAPGLRAVGDLFPGIGESLGAFERFVGLGQAFAKALAQPRALFLILANVAVCRGGLPRAAGSGPVSAKGDSPMLSWLRDMSSTRSRGSLLALVSGGDPAVLVAPARSALGADPPPAAPAEARPLAARPALPRRCRATTGIELTPIDRDSAVESIEILDGEDEALVNGKPFSAGELTAFLGDDGRLLAEILNLSDSERRNRLGHVEGGAKEESPWTKARSRPSRPKRVRWAAFRGRRMGRSRRSRRRSTAIRRRRPRLVRRIDRDRAR